MSAGNSEQHFTFPPPVFNFSGMEPEQVERIILMVSGNQPNPDTHHDEYLSWTRLSHQLHEDLDDALAADWRWGSAVVGHLHESEHEAAYTAAVRHAGAYILGAHRAEVAEQGEDYAGGIDSDTAAAWIDLATDPRVPEGPGADFGMRSALSFLPSHVVDNLLMKLMRRVHELRSSELPSQ